MSISNIITQTIYFSTTFVINRMLVNCDNYKKRAILHKNEFITSNNKDNLKIDLSSETATIEMFNLIPGRKGNSFLVPIFEVKDKKGRSISPQLEKLLDINKNVSEVSRMGAEKNMFFGTFIYETYVKLTYSVYTSDLLILRNPATNRLYIWLILTICVPTDIKIDDESLEIYEDRVDVFSLKVKGYLDVQVFLKATHNDMTEEYVLEFPSEFPSIRLHFEKTDSGMFILSDNNTRDKYAIIKPHRSDNQNEILKYHLFRKQKQRELEACFLKQKMELTTKLEHEKELRRALIKKLEQFEKQVKKVMGEKKSYTKTENKVECNEKSFNYIEEELKFTKEELDFTKQEMISTKNELKLTKNELKFVKDEMRLVKYEQKLTKDELKLAKYELKLAKDELAFTKVELKNTK
ncbi:hypothetical protein CDIK_2163 [Cucumispora dikerogammari]|nr:hypothetical protein CDIK_2163 [Cucumispora dikerogammari]